MLLDTMINTSISWMIMDDIGQGFNYKERETLPTDGYGYDDIMINISIKSMHVYKEKMPRQGARQQGIGAVENF